MIEITAPHEEEKECGIFLHFVKIHQALNMFAILPNRKKKC